MEAAIGDQYQQEAHREAESEQGLVAQEQDGINTLVIQADGGGGGDQQGNAPDHILHAQGGNEGMGKLQPGKQGTIDKAHQGGSQNAAQNQGNGTRNAEPLDQNTHHAGAKDRIVAHGQVDTTGNQADQHTGGDQTVNRGLLQQDHQVADGEEAAGRQAEEEEQKGKGQKRAHFGKNGR